jgi:hypothetical protein
MTRWMVGIAVICMMVGVASAQEPIVAIKVVPEKSVFKNSAWNKPIIIKSSEDAAKHFSKDVLKTLVTAVDFKKQFLLVFAWKGSGRDKLSYNVAESYPEQISFSLKPGRTRDLRPHTNVYALRSNVKWHVKGSKAQQSTGSTKVTIKLQVPDGGWRVQITQVHQTKTGLMAVSELSRVPGMAIQMISTVQDSVEVQTPVLPVKHLVLGKTWGWENQEPHTFLKDKGQLAKQLTGAKQIYQRNASAKEAADAARLRYIVVYRKEIFTNGETSKGESMEQIAKRHCREFGGSPPQVLKIINGFAADFPASGIEKLKNRQEVKYVEKDAPVGLHGGSLR